MTTLAYVRIGIDRDLYLTDGHYVIDPTGVTAEDRATGALLVRASADVLDLRCLDAVGGRRISAGFGSRRRDGGEVPKRTVATLIRAAMPLEGDDAAVTMEQWRRDPGEVDRWTSAALAVVNRAIRAYRLVWRDPYAIEITTEDLWFARVGHAPAETLAAGKPGDEIDALRGRRHRDSAGERVRPGEVISTALAGEVVLTEGEELLAFAAREANHHRMRSADEGLRAAVRLLTQELGPGSDEAQALAAIAARKPGGGPAPLLQALAGIQDVVDGWRVAASPRVGRAA